MDAILETFVDAIGEISLKHGMIRIELVSLSSSEPRVTQRLITSLQAFSQMLQTQNGMLEQLQKAGMIRPIEPPPAAEPAPERGGAVAALRRLVQIHPTPQPASDSRPASESPALELAPPRSPNFSES